jgi:predicted RNA-binding protein YlqC (UPF0109 family)
MKAFLEFVVRNLVDEPSAVRVHENNAASRVIYELEVHADDVGKVVGKHGQTIAAIRTLVGAAVSRGGQHVDVEILENDRNRPHHTATE